MQNALRSWSGSIFLGLRRMNPTSIPILSSDLQQSQLMIKRLVMEFRPVHENLLASGINI